nr:PqiC family protein [uncultured Rhodopila sp.]
MLSRRAAVILLAAAPAACSSPNPTLYVLAPEPGAVVAHAPRTIDVRPIALARYLERSAIVRSSEGYRMDVLANDWWGEPLDSMMMRVLVLDLTQRLPGSIVYGDTGAITTPPDATVEVNVQRFDLDRDGAVLLAAQVAIEGGAASARGVSQTVRPADGSTQALAGAMSSATARLADTIAAMLGDGGARRK